MNLQTTMATHHFSHDHLHDYLEKLNRYTDGEAESLYTDGASHSWQAQLAHFVHDWQGYYERARGDRDGMQGFVLAFMGAFYRFTARAKLWDLRRLRGELPVQEPVPTTVGEMLEFMAQVLRRGADPWLRLPAPDIQTVPVAHVPALWQGPLYDSHGFPNGSLNLVLALIEAGEPMALALDSLEDPDAKLPPAGRALIDAPAVPATTSAEWCITHAPLHSLHPHPNAQVNIARTMFEADRLPPGAEATLNAFDRIWVPSEFDREMFSQSGIDSDKISVLPEPIDPVPFADETLEPWPLPGEEAYRFLSLIDWTLRKGWDLLLEAFAAEFGNDPHVGLVLKVWSSLGYTLADMRAQADAHLRSKLGQGLNEFPNIHLWQETLPLHDLPRIYRAAEGFVLPFRAEGWCRPLMEAMAAGLPTIATAWSGPTAYHNHRVGYPLRCQLVPVSPAGTQETPRLTGHSWAEPDLTELRRLMRQLVADPQTARGRGLAASGTIAHQYSHAALSQLLREELARCRQLAAVQTPLCSPSERPPGETPEPRPMPLSPRANATPTVRDPLPADRFRAKSPDAAARPAAPTFKVIIPSALAANLVPCVHSVLTNEPTLPPESIIVIDDGARHEAEAHLPAIHWIAGTRPFVFSRNVNLGIREAGTDVILLNDDARLLTPFGLTLLAQEVQSRPDIGICSAGIHGMIGNPNQIAKGQAGLRQEHTMLAFVCVYIPQSVYDRIGLLDERFSGYGFEDNDYCARVTAAGLQLAVWDGCVVDHSGELPSTFRSRSNLDILFATNQKKFEDKWGRAG